MYNKSFFWNNSSTPAVNKMHSRRGHITTQLLETNPPTRLKLVSISDSSFVSSSRYVLPVFICLSFSFFIRAPSPSSLLLAVEVNHHLYYTHQQYAGQKEEKQPTLVVLSRSLSALSRSFFFLSLAKSHKKQVNCLETQYGLHPGDYTVSSASLH